MFIKKYSVDCVVPALKQYFMKHGYMPTYSELGSLIGISNRSVVRSYLLEAEEAGYIKLGRDLKGRIQPRAIYIKGMRVKWE